MNKKSQISWRRVTAFLSGCLLIIAALITYLGSKIYPQEYEFPLVPLYLAITLLIAGVIILTGLYQKELKKLLLGVQRRLE